MPDSPGKECREDGVGRKLRGILSVRAGGLGVVVMFSEGCFSGVWGKRERA